MKKLLLLFTLLCGLDALAQNLTTVSGSNITDLNGTKLGAGQVCFLGTDQQDNPISFQIGGGGQALRRQYCSAVTAGVITGFTVPNPANTLPTGIYYRVTVKDTSTGQEVLRYTQVIFSGGTFNFDNYAPTNLGNFAALTGTSVSGNLSVTGNVAATGTVTGSNIPSNIISTVQNAGSALTQRTILNCMAGLQCADNAGSTRTDMRVAGMTTVSFSATPTFDASTANMFKITLTANVTSSTLSNAVAGEPIGFYICQDGTGGRTFVWPANVLNPVTIPSGANACILQTFLYDGTNAQADGATAGQVLAQDGAVGTPSISFENNTNTGFYRIAANRIGLALNGANSIDFQTGITIFNSGTAKTNTYVMDINNADAGLSRTAAATIAVGNGTNGNASGTLQAASLTSLTGQISPNAAGGIDVGTTALPFSGVKIGAAATNNIRVTGTATAARTATLQDATDTFVMRATTDTLTNKTFDTAGTGNVFKINGTQYTATTGTGASLASSTGTAVLLAACTGTATSSTTLILGNTGCTFATGYQYPLSAGTLANLRCHAVTGGVNASSGVMTIRKNGSNTTMTCTFGTGTSCSDVTHTSSFANGDLWDIAYTTQGSETLAGINCSVDKQ